MNGVKKLSQFLVVFLLEIYRLMNYIRYSLDPTLAEIAMSLVELIRVSLNIIENIVRTILAFSPFLENL